MHKGLSRMTSNAQTFQTFVHAIAGKLFSPNVNILRNMQSNTSHEAKHLTIHSQSAKEATEEHSFYDGIFNSTWCIHFLHSHLLNHFQYAVVSLLPHAPPYQSCEVLL
eukprot:TRINITY_DN6555_c0_g1_i2.p1 TRINITY_DN6555_c0_g1~~TRINITY_DN6555_c0_g1_i2.p1  ORF type:complete len:108 (-),score=11.95 TRINITY_DN6555_c0_g1_i2:40-363(-)